jgi:uncharacterized protein YecE (DUF72 family)
MSDAKNSTKIRVGMGGWQLEPFNGIFYPSPAKKGFRKLELYGRYFDTVEVNATYHTNALTPKNAQQWLQDVSANERFVFSVKLFKGFTHTMDARQGDVTVVCNLLNPLAEQEKLFGLVMQFPSSFRNTAENRSHLAKLAKAFSAYPLFVEVRHDSWNTEDALKLLEDQRLHLINVDLPKIKQHMPLKDVAWGGRSYFRLMGRNAKSWDQPSSSRGQKTASESGRYLYRYSEKELEELAGLIRPISIKMDETEVILHNDPLGNSLFNGMQLRHLLNPKERIEAPPQLVRNFPELLESGVTTKSPEKKIFEL